MSEKLPEGQLVCGSQAFMSLIKCTSRHANTQTPTLRPYKHPLIYLSPFTPIRITSIRITSITAACLPLPSRTIPSRTMSFTPLHILSSFGPVSPYRPILRTLTRIRTHTQSHHTSNHTWTRRTSNCQVTHSYLNLPRSIPHKCTLLQTHTHKPLPRTQHTSNPLNDLRFLHFV
jgi:hypothetical protein